MSGDRPLISGLAAETHEPPLVRIAGRTPERTARDVRVWRDFLVLISYAAAVGLGYLWGSM
jgi:hypothetical protein